ARVELPRRYVTHYKADRAHTGRITRGRTPDEVLGKAKNVDTPQVARCRHISGSGTLEHEPGFPAVRAGEADSDERDRRAPTREATGWRRALSGLPLRRRAQRPRAAFRRPGPGSSQTPFPWKWRYRRRKAKSRSRRRSRVGLAGCTPQPQARGRVPPQ